MVEQDLVGLVDDQVASLELAVEKHAWVVHHHVDVEAKKTLKLFVDLLVHALQQQRSEHDVEVDRAVVEGLQHDGCSYHATLAHTCTC